MIEDLIMLRAAERILAIVIGGLSIWCGFRLFLAIPSHAADAEAELTLAENKRLLLSRISPGTFFALFGSAVVFASFYYSISFQTAAGDGYSGIGQRPAAPASPAVNAPAVPALDAASVRLSLAFLVDMEAELARQGTPDEQEWRARRFQAARLAIIGRGWQPGWGDIEEFELWLNEAPPRTVRPEFERALAVLEGRE